MAKIAICGKTVFISFEASPNIGHQVTVILSGSDFICISIASMWSLSACVSSCVQSNCSRFVIFLGSLSRRQCHLLFKRMHVLRPSSIVSFYAGFLLFGTFNAHHSTGISTLEPSTFELNFFFLEA